MKKSKFMRYAVSALLVCAAVSFTSCSDDNDDSNYAYVSLEGTNFEYTQSGVWADAFKPEALKVGDFTLTHTGEVFEYYTTWNGFAPSKVYNTELQSDWLGDYQFSAITGGGVAGKNTPFIVGFWSAYAEQTPGEHSVEIAKTDGGEFTPEGVYVTNACYAYYVMKLGNAYARKFKLGDYFHLEAYGVTAADKVVGPVTFALAKCAGDESGWMVDTWQWMDLRGLGKVKSVYFTMSSSDTGEWGMNTPAYFCIDGFKASL